MNQPAPGSQLLGCEGETLASALLLSPFIFVTDSAAANGRGEDLAAAASSIPSLSQFLLPHSAVPTPPTAQPHSCMYPSPTVNSLGENRMLLFYNLEQVRPQPFFLACL